MLNPAETYAQILADLEGELEALERAVFIALKRHPQGLTRPQLIALVFRTTPEENLSNSTKDRKIRKAIASLRAKRVPVLSNSGQAGYRLGINEAGKQALLADLRSRRNMLNERIAQVERFYTQPETAPGQRPLF